MNLINMEKYLTDIHAHFNDPRFDSDRDEAIRESFAEGLAFIINCGSSLEASEKSVEIAAAHERVYACVGIHPHDAGRVPPDFLERLRVLAANKKVVAIGEMGLDYYYKPFDKEAQTRLFTAQMELAAELSLPVVVHNRDAHADSLAIVKSFTGKIPRGVFHCFAGSVEMARELDKLGYKISVGGVATFKNAKTLHEVVRAVPSHMLLLETDCPYIAPAPHRGERNFSGYIKFIAEAIAELRGVSPDEIAKTTYENAREMFNIEV